MRSASASGLPNKLKPNCKPRGRIGDISASAELRDIKLVSSSIALDVGGERADGMN